MHPPCSQISSTDTEPSATYIERESRCPRYVMVLESFLFDTLLRQTMPSLARRLSRSIGLLHITASKEPENINKLRGVIRLWFTHTAEPTSSRKRRYEQSETAKDVLRTAVRCVRSAQGRRICSKFSMHDQTSLDATHCIRAAILPWYQLVSLV